MVPTSEQFCLYIKIMKEGPTFLHLCTVSDKNSERPESTGGTGQTCSASGSAGDGIVHWPIPPRSHSGLNIQWEAGTPPSFPSLQSGGNRVLGSPKWYAIFTTLCSIWGLLSWDLLPAVLPKPRNLTLGQLSPDVMENIWPAAWLQGLAVQPQCY